MGQDIENVTVGTGIVNILKQNGVTRIFGIPDGHTLSFYDGILHTEGIEHILVADERTAAFAADAYARVTGGLGIVDSGSAGSLNVVVGLAEAKGFGSSVLVIVGVVKKEHSLRNVPHDIDVQGVLEPITKISQGVYTPEQVPRFLNYAIRIATNGKPGPVALIIPEDVMNSKELPLKKFIPREGTGACAIEGCNIAPAASEVEYAVQLIREADYPALFVGSQAVTSGAFSEVKKLAEMLEAPVFSTISGKGILPQGDNHYFGTVGLFGERPNHKFLRKTADLLIVVGNRLTEDDTANFKIPPQKLPMIQIDLDPGEIGLSFNAWGVVGDSKIALDMIIQRLEEFDISSQEKPRELLNTRKIALKKLRLEHEKYRLKDTAKWMGADPIKPQRVLYSIAQNFTEDDYLVTDASASSRWIGAYFPIKGVGRKIITPRGVGPTGFGLGALLGTGIALKELFGPNSTPKLVLLTGDGGIMNSGLSDLETIVRNEINCTIIILNNKALGFVKFAQGMLHQKRYIDTDRPDTDFVKIAKAFGIKANRVKKLDELDEILKDSIQCKKGVHLIDVITDPEEFLPPNFY